MNPVECKYIPSFPVTLVVPIKEKAGISFVSLKTALALGQKCKKKRKKKGKESEEENFFSNIF